MTNIRELFLNDTLKKINIATQIINSNHMQQRLPILLLLFLSLNVFSQPIVSVVHNDLNILDRNTPANLVINGSFETGGPNAGPGTNSRPWTRSCNTVPAGWSMTSNSISYGMWTYKNDFDVIHYNQPPAFCDNSIQTTTSDPIMDIPADGFNQLYFGNYEITSGMVAPNYNAVSGEYIPRAGVAAAVAGLSGTQSGIDVVGTPVTIEQTVAGLTTGYYYEMEFSTSGEGNFGGGDPNSQFAFDGIFELNIGGKRFLLTCPGEFDQHGYDKRERYHIKFQASAASATIRFINFGHYVAINNPLMKGAGGWFLNNSDTRETSELVLDDVIINEQTIIVSGKVWNDVNNDGLSTAETNYTLGGCYINLVDPDGKILYSAPINPDGTYSIPAPMNTTGLSLQISTAAAALEADPNAPAPPVGYNATTATSIALTTTTVNVTDQDFGVKMIVLPLKLISFSGNVHNNMVMLNWKTSNEVNMKDYEIERSSNGINFVTIGNIDSRNIFNTDQQYNFTDPLQISGTNFYRLRMVDVDGRYSYSAVLKISNGKISENGISSVVNPFSDKISFQYRSVVTGQVWIKLTDMSGRTVRSLNTSVLTGVNSMNVEGLQTLPGGIYFIEVISSDNRTQKVKVVKN